MLLSLVLFSYQHAHAQLLIDKDENSLESQTTEFYEGCMADPVININEDTNTAFCACASVNYHTYLKNITLSDESEFMGTSIEVNLDAKGYLTEIYASCLYIPQYNLTFEECLSKDYIKRMYGRDWNRYHGYCSCEAKGISEYFEKFAKPYFDKRVAEGKSLISPLDDILNDTDFFSAKLFIENTCMDAWRVK